MIRFLKSYMLPIAMCLGLVFYQFFASLIFITPYLIFAMLFITYSKLSIKEIRFEKFHFYLLAIQLFGSILVYMLLYNIHPTIAQGSMICILAPTATSAAVITGMLGGSISSLTAYSILSNFCVAICGPVIFSFIGKHQDISFLGSLLQILKEMFPLLILPLACALILEKTLPAVKKRIETLHSLSFYLWGIALIIVTGKTVSFVRQQSAANYPLEIGLAVCTCIICIGQFIAGRQIGRRYQNTVTGGQGLGQKNTILTIWMSISYMDPLSSIGPGAYVLWQNMVNSFQLWKFQRKMTK